MFAQTTPIWNSLEVAKLAVAVLTPLSVLGFGFWVNHRLKVFEHLQWASQKVIEKRLELYQEITPLLNDLLCYFTYIGGWKETTPGHMVKLKRSLDRLAYVNAPLLPPEFLRRYNEFVSKCYSTYSGWGRDALLRTAFARRQAAMAEEWQGEWAECFAAESDGTDPEEIRRTYSELVAYLANELGVGVQAEPVRTGRVPANIR